MVDQAQTAAALTAQKRPVRAVFFDLDDTLLQTTSADNLAMEEVAAKLAESHPNAPWSDIQAAWSAAFKKSPWDNTHTVPVQEWRARLWTQALVDHGVTDEAVGPGLQSCYHAGRTKRFRLTQQTKDMVNEVKARGYRVAVITNGHTEVQRGKIAATEVRDVVGENVLIGGEEIAAGRHEKPHASIFHSACRLVGCEPHEAIHVGDSLAADIQGGINAGLAATVWVNPRGTPALEGGPQPTYCIGHVDQLLPILDRLSADNDADGMRSSHPIGHCTSGRLSDTN